jgi:hypothetical protein
VIAAIERNSRAPYGRRNWTGALRVRGARWFASNSSPRRSGLRVVRILDLQPGRHTAALIRAVPPLGHDPLEIVLADPLKKSRPRPST